MASLTRKALVSPLGLLFGCTLFASSSLLFFVQPMFAKMALPLLGGSPGVWNTCVVFFQAALLCGYGYAHAVTRLPLPAQVGTHAGLLALAVYTLPIAIPADWQPPTDGAPIVWLLGLLSAIVGVPFVVASASAPLLQRWFSLTRQSSGSDPYLLYATSNLGSLASLLAYPFVVEPTWPLPVQSGIWAWSFGAVGALITICGILVCRSRVGTRLPENTGSDPEAFRIGWWQRGRWIALAAVPSSLMLSVTTYLSTDVAAVPLLWILPLAGYLLSFAVAFGPRALIRRDLPSRLAPILVSAVALFLVQNAGLPLPLAVVLHLLCFCAVATALHLELAAERPSARRLTEFYLWLSVGGVVGGVFNGILSPLLFTTVVEYPIGLVLACLLLPRADGSPRGGPLGLLSPLAMGVLVWAGTSWISSARLDPRLGVMILAPVALWGFSISRERWRFALAIACCFVGGTFGADRQNVLLEERSFFGVYRVERDSGAAVRTLWHGTTLHGQQSLDSKRRLEPLTYYHPSGPIGQALTSLLEDLPGARVAAVGLGAGSLAAYAQPAQKWTFYEIDPAVEAIATNPHFFTYLRDCGARCRVVLGDARLSLARGRGELYDLIVLDAFSSDAIPVHLLTREALDLYLSRLAPSGVLAFHISNRHLALSPVLGALFADRGLAGLAQSHYVAQPDRAGRSSSEWLLAARHRQAFGVLSADPRWAVTAGGAARRVWTDEYSDVVSALKASSAFGQALHASIPPPQ